MSFVVYEVDTTRFAGRRGRYSDPIFASAGAAKSHIARLVKSGKYMRDQVTFAPTDFFFSHIEKKVVRKHLLNGADILEPINTPGYLSPSSEAYWSM